MVYVPWYKIHVHGNVFPELSRMNQRINIMVSPLAKESTPPRKHFQQLRKFWVVRQMSQHLYLQVKKKDRGSMRDVILRQECGSEHKEEGEVSKTIRTFVIPQELEVMSLHHTYIASRPKADSVIQGITIPSQINQRMKKTVPIFNLHEYSCLAPHTMNNYINNFHVCTYIEQRNYLSSLLVYDHILSYFLEETLQTLLSQLLQELPDLSLFTKMLKGVVMR